MSSEKLSVADLRRLIEDWREHAEIKRQHGDDNPRLELEGAQMQRLAIELEGVIESGGYGEPDNDEEWESVNVALSKNEKLRRAESQVAAKAGVDRSDVRVSVTRDDDGDATYSASIRGDGDE